MYVLMCANVCTNVCTIVCTCIYYCVVCVLLMFELHTNGWDVPYSLNRCDECCTIVCIRNSHMAHVLCSVDVNYVMCVDTVWTKYRKYVIILVKATAI